MKSSLLIILLAVNLGVRILTAFGVNKIPCMDSHYLSQTQMIINSNFSVNYIHLTPLYGFILNFMFLCTNDVFLASALLYVFFSFGITYLLYEIAKLLFNERCAYIVLGITAFLPHLTVAIAGYSHTACVASFFVLLSLSLLLKIVIMQNFSLLNCIFFAIISILAIFIRPENLIIQIFLLIWIAFAFKNWSLQNSSKLLLIIGLISCGVLIHKSFIQSVSKSSTISVFSDKQYSYLTYMHTLSLRKTNSIVDSVAIFEGEQKFGSAIRNEFSILNAIKIIQLLH